MKRRKFGELLLSQGVVTREQLDDALDIQRRDGGLLGEIMVQKGFISENEIVRSLSTQYGLPVLRIRDYDVDTELVGSFPTELLYINLVVPLSAVADLLLVTVADLPDDETIKTLEETGQREVVFYLSSATDIRTALGKLVPVSDDDQARYISLRRRKGPSSSSSQKTVKREAQKSSVASGTPAPDAETAEQSLFGELDNAWENIFDEAEQNLKQNGV